MGSDFAINAGVGLVIKMKPRDGPEMDQVTVLDQITAAFERDWRSPYAKSIQGNKDRVAKYRHLQHAELKPNQY